MTAALLWAGCRDFAVDDRVNEMLADKPVNVDLAFTFSSDRSGNQTRQASEVVDGSGRIVTIQRIVPLIEEKPSSSIFGSMQSTGVKTDNTTTPETKAKFFYYENCLLSRGVDHFLVYGQAADIIKNGVATKAHNGSLISNIPYPVQSISDISFAPEPIYTATTAPENGEAWSLANKLTQIANVAYSGQKWSEETTDKNLETLYKNFTNHGYDLPGSAASVKAWIGALIAAAGTPADNTLLHAIKTEAETAYNSINVSSGSYYPNNIGLPDGAAVLRWTEWKDENNVTHEGFKPQLQATTLDNINSVSRFAYPAALHFYVNSPIQTSNEPVKFDEKYEPSNITAWSQVLASYTSGDRITSETQAVALRDPVQYAVAQLKVTVKANAELSDNTSPTPQSITVGTSSFPLTGIIVCGQREVGYDFAPKDNSDADVKFIYDSQVTSGSYLTTSGTQPTTTLVLQSYDGENVNIILEFENNSGVTFQCIDGKVYPNTRFYLIGEIDATTGTGTKPDGINRVFTKDYITEVNMQVVSLAKAYNVLPNILSSNLEIGVMTTPQWIAAEPESVKLN